MLQYLLLRDNKESGPYNAEQLREMGLKAYDLIWIEGRSAAWRYPCEVPELKDFAPAVTEQPFDRFFKKADTAQNGEISANTPRENKTPANPPYNSFQNRNTGSSNPSTKRIVVILPDKRAVEHERAFHQSQPPVVPPPPVSKDEPVLEQKFAQPLDDVKHQYIENVLQQKKVGHKRRSNKKKWIGSIATILVVGTVFGLAFNSTLRSKKSVAEEVIPAVNTLHVVDTTSRIPSSESDNANFINPESPLQTDSTALSPLITDSLPHKHILKKPVLVAKNEQPVEQAVIPAAYTPEEKKPVAVNIPSPEDSKKEAVKRKINDLITVKEGDYKVGPFGGISNVQLAVTNSSPYPMDLVVVEVKYILANKKTFKTENVYFQNVNAGKTVMADAPKSPRGLKIESRVSLITARSLGMYHASL